MAQPQQMSRRAASEGSEARYTASGFCVRDAFSTSLTLSHTGNTAKRDKKTRHT